MSAVRTLCFEIVPTDWDGVKLTGLPFQPMLIDVPSLDVDADGRAARRAYWSAFHILGPKGVEPEEFQVHEYSEAFGRGRQVGPGGFVS